MKCKALNLLVLLLVICNSGISQVVGLIEKSNEVQNGYTLFHPDFSKTTFLIDNNGYMVHSWEGQYTPGRTVYLLENGLLLRSGNYSGTPFGAGGKGGYLELVDWDGTITWSYLIANDTAVQHHDMVYLSNGNILTIVWDKRTVDEALEAGRDPAKLGNSLWSEKIVELKPIGNNEAEIVWEWSVWDHLIQDFNSSKENYGIVADHPERINLNYVNESTSLDNWLHVNALDYNANLDQIIISSNRFNEIWIIDHSTTLEEAKTSSGGNSGMGGDLLYRWGNPKTHNQEAKGDQKLFGQHNCQWIPNSFIDGGKIMYFNNGAGRGEDFSSVEIIDPLFDPLSKRYPKNDNGLNFPTDPLWIFTAQNKTDFFSRIISGAQRLSNGNTLICEGLSGNIFEINQNKEVVWKYINPVNNTGNVCDTVSSISNNGVFRAVKYDTSYGAFASRAMSPLGKIELTNCVVTTVEDHLHHNLITLFPNPSQGNITLAHPTPCTVSIYNSSGILIKELETTGEETKIDGLLPGFYCLVFNLNKTQTFTRKILVE